MTKLSLPALRRPEVRPRRRISWWKLLGAAGLAGVAATGALAVRGERRRQAMTPDEVRSRLHSRYAELGDPSYRPQR